MQFLSQDNSTGNRQALITAVEGQSLLKRKAASSLYGRFIRKYMADLRRAPKRELFNKAQAEGAKFGVEQALHADLLPPPLGANETRPTPAVVRYRSRYAVHRVVGRRVRACVVCGRAAGHCCCASAIVYAQRGTGAGA